MTKEVLYTYLGTNGTITSPVHLEDIYYTRSVKLSADRKKVLTRDGKNFFYSVTVPEDEVAEWREVNEKA
jgi:hypothetical protein